MRKPLPTLITAALFLTSVISYSATIGGGLAPVSGVLGVTPGEFSFKQYDQGELEKYAAQIARERGDADRDYFLQSVQKINSQFTDHVRSTILSSDGLKQMSNRAYKVPAEWTAADEYLSAIDRYNVSKTALLGTIASLKAYGEQALQASESVLPDGTIVKIRGYGQVNFEPIVQNYLSEISRIEETLKNLKLNLKLADGSELALPPGSKRSLDPSITATAISIDPKTLADWRLQSQRLRRWSPGEDKPVIDAYTNYARRMVGKLLTLYGTTERYRFHSPEYKAEKAKLENEVAEIFWSRSYIRARYGLQLGAIQTAYTKRIANLDVFFTKSEDLAKFREENAWTAEDLASARQNFRLALDVAKDRSILAETGEGWGMINSTLQKANYFFTWVGGKHELADSARVVLEMMAADLYEEMLVVQPGALAIVQSNYKSRYYINDEAKAKIVEMAKRFDPKSWATDEASEDPLADLGKIEVGAGDGFTATGGLAQVFADVLVKCQQKEEVDLPRALQLERNIRIAMMGVKNTRGKDATNGLR